MVNRAGTAYFKATYLANSSKVLPLSLSRICISSLGEYMRPYIEPLLAERKWRTILQVRDIPRTRLNILAALLYNAIAPHINNTID